jgi:hypothetical protein
VAAKPSDRRRPGCADCCIDTLLSVNAAAAAAMEGLVAQAEAHAAFSLAVAEVDARRVESLRQLQTMLRGYDFALSTYAQPFSPAGLDPSAAQR